MALEHKKREFHLRSEGNGYFSGLKPAVKAGDLYRFRLDNGASYPDPWSRFQPEGPHGPSLVVDSEAFSWSDEDWKGVKMPGQVLYELHIGTFTKEGTFDAARKELKELKDLGITVVEVMPVNECPGRWNWGYDGVNLFAPYHTYGDPEAFKRFVNEAHSLGLGVILDVVYNHLGPDGNYLRFFSEDFFTSRYKTDWGNSINFDGPNAGPVREFFIQNACYWISDFHLDGLRLDATQNIYDSSPTHILAEISKRARQAANSRDIILIAENEPQQIRLLAPVKRGGYGLDAIWNDDFHHGARVAVTGFREAYYMDYMGLPQELISCVKRGFLYQGQHSLQRNQRRGSAVSQEPASSFVFYVQNHDQVGNSLGGVRITELIGQDKYRALAALQFLAPFTPMFFMGQEFGASSPFLFFTDHTEELAKNVWRGRLDFLSQFPSFMTPEGLKRIPYSNDPSTFERCKLDFSERKKNAPLYLFHKELLHLRASQPVFAAQDRKALDGSVLGDKTFGIRFFGGIHGDFLLIVNLNGALSLEPAPDPLLAPPPQQEWALFWASDKKRYGGTEASRQWNPSTWPIPKETSLLLKSQRNNNGHQPG